MVDVRQTGPTPGRLQAFGEHDNATATPFDWRFSTKDLTALLERLDAHVALAA